MHISIHAPRVGSDQQPVNVNNAVFSISIHAPRVGSDLEVSITICKYMISIHAPRVGSDHNGGGYYRNGDEFQSTLPV